MGDVIGQGRFARKRKSRPVRTPDNWQQIVRDWRVAIPAMAEATYVKAQHHTQGVYDCLVIQQRGPFAEIEYHDECGDYWSYWVSVDALYPKLPEGE